MARLSQFSGVPFSSNIPKYLSWDGSQVVRGKAGSTVASGIVPNVGGNIDLATIGTMDSNTSLTLMQYINGVPVDLEKLYPYKKAPISAWQSYTPIWSASSTNPGNGGVWEAFYRRVGDCIEIRGYYYHTSPRSPGSGLFYLISYPPGLSINHTKTPGIDQRFAVHGSAKFGFMGSYIEGQAIAYTQGIVFTLDKDGTTNELFGPATSNFNLQVPTVNIGFNITVPVFDFEVGQEDYGIKLNATGPNNIRISVGAKADENTEWSAINSTGNWFVRLSTVV